MSDSFVNTKMRDKVKWSLPWLLRYPAWRAGEFLSRANESSGPTHLIFVVANHFEPGLGRPAVERLQKWCELARATGDALRDHDGTPFRHTNFFPAEQYERPLLEMLSALQADGYGEVEIHLHHGVERADTAENTRRQLETFRDVLAEEHKCLARFADDPFDTQPKYGFVHGNWALANSAGGRFCGVDSEMQILADTGCYADFTLPSVPFQSQVPRINAIYQCGHSLAEARPHRSGRSLRVGEPLQLPIIFTGPLVFDWTRRVRGLPIPRVEDGALAQNYPLTMDRLQRWRSAGIGVKERPEWIFIKLYSHGFFDWDQDLMIGEQMKRFMGEVLETAERTGEYKVHFASAREAFNMVAAAVDGRDGLPGAFRDYKLRQIMDEQAIPKMHGEIDRERESLVVLR
ncbi:MAG TPA: hypothetical protein VKC61_13865 [Pyrinomonadaceae bacterium]|nr:hypothetical protein [Pyrinomonadaceae bacterium]